MPFLPKFPLHLSPFLLFGLTLLAGLIGGELAKTTRILPRISGYIIIGMIIGPQGLNLVSYSLLSDISIFVNICLGLIMFQLGRHLDFLWLKKEPSLIAMSIFECLTTFALIFMLFLLLHASCLAAALAGTIAIATSPTVIMTVAKDLSSEGPVTRRTFLLASCNNFFALLLFSVLLPLANSTHLSWPIELFYCGYRLFASIFMGIIMFFIVKFLTYLIGKNKENQFVLFFAAVVITINLASVFHLSTMLTLFTLGTAARNFDYNYHLLEIDFGWSSHLFIIPLFVATGIYLQYQELQQGILIIVAFLGIRIFSKITGVALFAKASRITLQQTIAIGIALTPMAATAVGMLNTITIANSTIGYSILNIISPAIALLSLFGPIAAQVAFIKTHEAMHISN